MKKDLSGMLVKTVFSLLTFLVFLLLLSPVYVYRSVRLEITCTSSAKAELEIAPMRNLSDALTQQAEQSERYFLEASERPARTVLELPSDNRIGCLWIRFRKIPYDFRLHGITILNGREKIPVKLKDFAAGPQDSKYVIPEDQQLRIISARKLSIAFPLGKLLRITRRLDPVPALYMLLLALLPAILVFCRTEVELSRRSWLYILYSAAAVFMLTVPVLLIDYYSTLSKENRFVTPFPEIFTHRRINHLFPKQFEKWFADRFTGREGAILKERKIFSPENLPTGDFRYTDAAIIRKDYWIFYRLHNNEAMYQNKNRFTQEQLELFAERIQKMNDFLKKRKIRFYVMMTPDKERIYPEYYPPRYKQVHPESRLEQLYHYLSANTKNVKIIFPLPELLKEKEKYLVYAKAGTHWTPRGAYAAFRMLHRELRKDFPEMPADQPNAEVWYSAPTADIDLALLLGYNGPGNPLPADVLSHEVSQIKSPHIVRPFEEIPAGQSVVQEFCPVEKPRKNALKVFAYTDSFWNAFVPFMFPCMQWIIRVDFSLFDAAFFKLVLDRKKPDVVIVEATERFLDRFLTLAVDGD